MNEFYFITFYRIVLFYSTLLVFVSPGSVYQTLQLPHQYKAVS